MQTTNDPESSLSRKVTVILLPLYRDIHTSRNMQDHANAAGIGTLQGDDISTCVFS